LTQKQTDRQTDRQTDKQADRQTTGRHLPYRHMQCKACNIVTRNAQFMSCMGTKLLLRASQTTYRLTGRQTERLTDRHTTACIAINAISWPWMQHYVVWMSFKLSLRQRATDRQTDRQTDKQTDTQTDTQTRYICILTLNDAVSVA